MDDMGWGDLGCYGNPARETPNLDQMASQGMLFTDFYSASSICSPSYAPQEVLGGIAASEVLISEVLQKAGYRNKIVGKWHLGHQAEYLPLQHGFHEWFGAPNCHYKYDDKIMPNIPVYRNHLMTGRYYDDYKIDHKTGIANLTQMYIQEALVFLERQTRMKQPFFLYWAPDATHTPLYASAKFRGRSSRGLYGDAVMEIDDGIGQIFDKLKQLHLDNNTFVFFSSDNGAATYAFTEGGSNGPFLCGKQTTFEGGFRQPGIAWWPGKIKGGQVSNQVGNLMDLYLTMLDMAALPRPRGVVFDGTSLLPTMLNGTRKDRAVFYYRGDTLFKVRLGQYKAHFYTWNTPQDAQDIGYHYCPGQRIANVTTDQMVNYTHSPLLFHLGRDPGEKFIIPSHTAEYRAVLPLLLKTVHEHQRSLQPAKPQFNWCDLAVQNWAPQGCERINKCMMAPMSYLYRCTWPY
ncbi:N-acetylgalactosamine-6-sulfatase [Lamellibrachia satsuma]|nr:N-acetylgalactosamine-6-sulfatase [Lamellibrachia satsuma]